MTVLALVSESSEADDTVRFSAQFALAQKTNLVILCYRYAPASAYPLLADETQLESADELVSRVRAVVEELLAETQDQSLRDLIQSGQCKIETSIEPDKVAATLEAVERERVTLLVVPAGKGDDRRRNPGRNNPILRQSPCDTILLFRGGNLVGDQRRVMVTTYGSSVDAAVTQLGKQVTADKRGNLLLARLEDDPGVNAVEVGRRELKHLAEAQGIRKREGVKLRVFLQDDVATLFKSAQASDLFLVGLNSPVSIHNLLNATTRPAVAIVKRAPPLRLWDKHRRKNLLAPLSPAAYGDLIQSLRRDSRLNEGFLVMLGLASAIASLGLLQDSPAVVIGSMLLAPLMTPMIGCGLSTAQANPVLGRAALKTILVGFLVTLFISTTIGWITPGVDVTAQVTSRVSPNILDMLIALFSGAAAAYAMARPSIAGAVAGVAIATAIVPPLCSSGICIAYHQYEYAFGAGVLFVTNAVAIILSAAIVFRLLGVTSARSTKWQRRWVFRVLAILGLMILALSVPLYFQLEKSILEGKPQPTTYPLTKEVDDAIVTEIEKQEGVQLVASGRPASTFDTADVVLVLASRNNIDKSLADRLTTIVQEKMRDDTLVVEVFCLRNLWHTVEE